MRTLIALLLLSSAAFGQQTVVFKSVNVIPMDTERVLENQDVVVSDGKIKGMGTTGKVKYGKSALVVEAKGKYLIPGLAEMHAHIPPNDNVVAQKEVLMLFALNGVTTIRGMLGHPSHLTLREQVKRGEVLGPHIYTSGPSFNGNSVTSPEGGANMVREEKGAGYDFLKLHPGLTLENFNAIIRAANEVGITYGGHVSAAVGVWRAIDANYSTIDHCDGFIEGMVPGIEAMTPEQIGFFGLFVAKKADLSMVPKLVEGLREHKVWVVPTQSLYERWISANTSPEELRKAPEMKYMDSKVLDQWVESKKNQMRTDGYNAEVVGNFISIRRQLVKACSQGGVGMLLGSDAPQVFNVPGFSIHHELKYMVQAGLTPYEALKMGTVNVAAFYNLSATSGTVTQGKVSDLVLLNANPLKDISATTSIEGVMLGNKWMGREFIDGELKRLVKQ